MGEAGDQILRGTLIEADEKNVEIRAITKLAPAKFSQRDDGQRAVGIEQLIDVGETGFGEIVLLREQLRQGRKPKDITQKNAEQLALPINAHGIDIRGGRA